MEAPLFATRCDCTRHRGQFSALLWLFNDLSTIPDLGKGFSGHPDCSKWIFGLLVHHLLQQVFQENNTFGKGIGCITASKALLSHQACIIIDQCIHRSEQVLRLSNAHVPATSTGLAEVASIMNFLGSLQVSPTVHDTCAVGCPEQSSYTYRMTHVSSALGMEYSI